MKCHLNPSARFNHISNAKPWHGLNFPEHLGPGVSAQKDASPGTHCLQASPLILPRFARQQAMKLTPVIYQPSWMGCLLLQHSEGVTEGESNRGERWRSGGSDGGRGGIKAGGRGERERGGMNRRRELGAARCRGRVQCHGCQGVCLVFFVFFSLCLHACVYEGVSSVDTINTRWRGGLRGGVNEEKKSVGLFKKNK